MLLYSNTRDVRILGEVAGSVLYSRANTFYGLVLAVVNIIVQVLIDTDTNISPKIANNYGLSALGMVVAFTIVFRTKLAWQRYWEALGMVFLMYSKWRDACITFLAFANSSIHNMLVSGGEGAKKKIERLELLKCTVTRHCCLLSALASDRLSHGDSDRMDLMAGKVSWSQQVIPSMTLHRMEGVENLPTFKLWSPGEALTCADDWNHEYALMDLPSKVEVDALNNSKDRVAVVLYWIIFDLAEASHEMDIAPPIQTRLFQEFSNGMVGFIEALEISDVPFPFPYAQLCTLLVITFACFVPFYMACFTQSLIAGPILTFVVFETFWCINETARDLENPFGNSLNDIHLDDFHNRFLEFIGEVDPAHDTTTNCEESPHLLKVNRKE